MEESDENIETISDDDSSEDCNSLLFSGYEEINETNFQYDLPRYSLEDEALMVIDDDSLSLSSNSSSEIINVRKQLNEPTSITILEEQIIVSDDSDIEIYDQMVPIKKNIVSAATKNTNLFTSQKENNSLNSKKIFISNNNTSTVKLNPLVKSNQTKIASSTTSVNKSKPTFIQLQPESSLNTKYPLNDKSVLKPKPQLKITSSNESKSEVYIVPCNGINYMISKKQNPVLKSDSSFTPTFTSSSPVIPIEPKTQLIIRPPKDGPSDTNKEVSKFSARMQQLPTRKFKLVSKEQIPTNLKRVFKQNPNFVKQTIDTNPTPNRNKVGEFFRIGNSWQTTRIKKTRNFQRKRLDVLTGKSPWSKMSKTVDITKANRNNKFIPHTVTSKDTMEKHSNIFFQNCEANSNPNYDKKHMPLSTFLKLDILNSQSESLPLNNTRYGLYKL